MSSFVWHSRHTKELIFAILEEMMTPSREGWGSVVQKYGSAASAAEAALAAEAAESLGHPAAGHLLDKVLHQLELL